MDKLQEIFIRIQNTKKEQKELKNMYRDALSNSEQYKNILDELKLLKERKKAIENSLGEDFASEFDKLENLKADLENDGQLLSDVALNKVVKGEPIEIKDEFDTEYEPIFSVKFKKSK